MSSLEVKELPRLTDTHIGKAKIEKLSSDLNVKYALLESAISAVLHISFSFRFFFSVLFDYKLLYSISSGKFWYFYN